MSLSDVELRPASTNDENEILLWRNDPITVSFTPKKNTVSRIEHREWFKKQLQSESDLLLIAFIGDKKFGMVRFDLVEPSINKYYEISINLNPSFRGKKFSSHIIDLGIKYLNDRKKIIFPIFAKISDENIPSLKSFKKSKFEKYQVNDNDPYIKENVYEGWGYYIYNHT